MVLKKFAVFLGRAQGPSEEAVPYVSEDLEAWAEEQPSADQAEARKLTRLWRICEPAAAATPTQAQINKAWLSLQAQLPGSATSLPIPQVSYGFMHRFWHWGTAIAAALLVGAGIYFFQKAMPAQDAELVVYVHTGTAPKQLSLADNTQVWLNTGAVFAYPEAFSGGQRNVYLRKGQAYFEVHADPALPFAVHTERFSTYVEGTAFDIQYSPEQSLVSVREGRVRVEKPDKTSDPIRLKAHQQGVFTPTTRYVRALKDENFLAWQTQRLSFKNVALAEVLKALSTYYKVPLQLTPQQSICALTVTFDKNTLVEALETIEMLTKAKRSTLPEGGYLLDPRHCP